MRGKGSGRTARDGRGYADHDQSDGWEIGVGPSVVVLDKGTARSLTTSTARDDIYALIFGQTGLMPGVGIQGSKVTRIHPGK